MNNERKILAGILCAAFVLTSSALIFAQQKQPAGGDVMIFQREKVVQGPEGAAPPPPQPGEDNFFFVTSEMSFDGKLVKGAPYSAQAVTEMTQLLGDGNRIVNKSTASVYRDNEGRTRREQTLRAIGPFATGSEAPQTIFISDPVAGTTYMLDARTHVARKTSSFRFEYKSAPPVTGVRAPASADEAAPQIAPEPGKGGAGVFVMATPEPGGDTLMAAPRAPALAGELGRTMSSDSGFVMEFHGNEHKNAKTESLGKQAVEGVEAEGTRTTVTIAAGEIGNERAIEIVSERWYSPELQTVIMTRHSDPRFGETVYRLTNINRSEPAKSLFEVPGDFTIKEAPAMGPMRMRTRKPADEQ